MEMEHSNDIEQSSPMTGSVQQLQCDICRYPFTTHIGRNLHVEKAHKFVEGKSITCPLCEVLFSHKTGMTRHLLRVHGATLDSLQLEYGYNCRQCQTPFRDKRVCLTHEANDHLQIEGKSVRCLKCNVVFSNHLPYYKHMKKVHGEGVLCFIEEIVQDGGGSGGISSTQNEVHATSGSSTRFSCTVCSKTYSRRYNCINHAIKGHSREIERIYLNSFPNVEVPEAETVADFLINAEVLDGHPEDSVQCEEFFNSIFQDPYPR